MQIDLFRTVHPWCWLTAVQNAAAVQAVAAVIAAVAAITAGIFAAKAYHAAISQLDQAQQQTRVAKEEIVLLEKQNKTAMAQMELAARQMDLGMQPSLVLASPTGGERFVLRNVGKGSALSVTYEYITVFDVEHAIQRARQHPLPHQIPTNLIVAGEEQVLRQLVGDSLRTDLVLFRYESIDGRVSFMTVKINQHNELVHDHHRVLSR